MGLYSSSRALNYVNVGSGSTIDTFTAMTYLGWFRFTYITATDYGLMGLGTFAAGQDRKDFSINVEAGVLDMVVDRATTDMRCQCNWTPALNVWYFLSLSWANNSTLPRLYLGSLSSVAAEPSSYTLQDDGGGTIGDSTANNMYLGNIGLADRSFIGVLGPCQIYNRGLSAQEVRKLQYSMLNPGAPELLSGCVGAWNPGHSGTQQLFDYSGNRNHGTVTGFVPREYPPAPRPLERRKRVAKSGTGAQTITCTGIAGAEAFGSATLSLSIAPTGIASGEALGTSALHQTIAPSGITTGGEAFGTAALHLAITASGVASGEAFGTATLGLFVTASGIASAETFGTANVFPTTLVAPGGIAGGEAFGTAALHLAIAASGAASGEAFGTATLGLFVTASGIAGAEAFGSAALVSTAIVATSGIATAEAFGSPALLLAIVAQAIATAEAFGTAVLDGGAVTAKFPAGGTLRRGGAAGSLRRGGPAGGLRRGGLAGTLWRDEAG